MTILFVALAAVMVTAALAVVALPVLRANRGSTSPACRRKALDQALAAGVIGAEEYAVKLAHADMTKPAPTTRSREAFAILLAVVLLLPAAAIGLYLLLGEPNALGTTSVVAGPTDETAPEMDQAIAALSAKLAQAPDDPEGWLLLGRAYKSTQRFIEARDAVKHATDLAPDNLDAMVEYGEALALASESRQLDGEARRMIEKALMADPSHQRGLWLLGVSDYQAGRYAEAIARWETLKSLLPADSGVIASVQAQIDEARAKAGSNDAAPGKITASAAPRLQVEIRLDPKFATQVAPNDALFVFARAAHGPPMPLAIQRLNAAALPATVILTEDMGMLPNLKLSQFPQVIIGARVSKSGNAIAASGDIQALSSPIDIHRRESVTLTLDQVVP